MIRGTSNAAVCGERWGRLLTVRLAAAYCSLTIGQFRELFAGAITKIHGLERVDRFDLDAEIDAAKPAKATKKG